MTKVLLLSAYEAESHRYWREGLLRAFPDIEFTCLVLPSRHFQWRIRGNALYWSQDMGAVLARDFDVVLATSMVDLATLRGLKPQLCSVPNILYFHENQLDFPLSEIAKGRLEPAMVNLYGALAADQLVFNSEYNLETFLSGCSALLAKFPDYVPTGVCDTLTAKASVLPVPIDDDLFCAVDESVALQRQGGHIVWNHRWEYDKGPELLLSIIAALPENAELHFSIIGQQFRQQPEAFESIKSLLEKRGWLAHFGYLEDRAEYLKVLQQSQIVLSTAKHEYQGLALLEACASGCLPVVPDRLAYKYYVPEIYRYQGGDEEAATAAALIMHLLDSDTQPSEFARDFSWSAQKSAYERLLKR